MRSAFTDFIVDQLLPLGSITAKPMYGCVALMRWGRMFAMTSPDDRLFVKADDLNRSLFENVGCPAFTYTATNKAGVSKVVTMSYFEPPESALENQEELLTWVRLGLEATSRMPEKKPRKVAGFFPEGETP